MKIKTSHIIHTILFGSFFSITLVILWGLNKGFDLTDMGYHLMTVAYPYESLPIYQYQHFVHQFFGWMDLGATGYRGLRLFLNLLSAGLFVWGLDKWLHYQNISYTKLMSFMGLFAFCMLGNYMSCAGQGTTLSYNNMTLIMIQASMGCFLYIQSLSLSETSHVFRHRLSSVLLGLLLCGVFFAKFTSGLLLLGFLGLLFLITQLGRGVAFPKIFMEGLFVLLGWFLLMGYYHITIRPLSAWYVDLSQSLLTLPDHPPALIVQRYIRSETRMIVESFAHYWPILLSIFVFFQAYKWANLKENFLTRNKKMAFYGIFGCILAYFAYKTYILGAHKGNLLYNSRQVNGFYTINVLILLLGVLSLQTSYNIRSWLNPKSREKRLMLLLLFILPFIGAFGTNNPMPYQSIAYLFSWFFVCLLLMFKITQQSQTTFFAGGTILVMSIFCTTQVITGHIHHPYRMKALYNQTEALEGLLLKETVLVDPKIKGYVEEVNTVIQERTTFELGDPIIAAQKMPGMVYLLGGVSPHSSWFELPYEKSNCNNLRSTQLTNMQDVIILVNENRRLPDHFINCLQEAGVNYPADYRLIGQVDKRLKSKLRLNILAPVQIIESDYLTQAVKIADLSPLPQKLTGIQKAEKRVQTMPNAQNYFELGILLLKKERNKEAISAFHKSLSYEKTADAYSSLCLAYVRTQNWERAQQTCDTSLLLEPNHERGIRHKKRLEQRLHQWQKQEAKRKNNN